MSVGDDRGHDMRKSAFRSIRKSGWLMVRAYAQIVPVLERGGSSSVDYFAHTTQKKTSWQLDVERGRNV